MDEQRERTFRRLKLVARVLQFLDARENGLQLRRVVVHLEAEFLRLHHDVAAAREIADEHAACVAHGLRIDMLVTVRELLHRVHMHPALVREGRRANPRLAGAVADVRDLVHELRKLLELRQRFRREAAQAHL